MALSTTCKLCETRRARRNCPGVGGDICALCCGNEREVSINCPLECPHLQDAHRHEKLPPVNPQTFPNRDIKLTDHFISEHEDLLTVASMALLEATTMAPAAVDADVREALESLIRTYRTRESGLYYETRPANLLAAAIHQHLQQRFEDYRRLLRERAGVRAVRDSEILGVLVFWQELALSHDNGRRLGRHFLSFLREALAGSGLSLRPRAIEGPPTSPLVVP